jgi:hypothetical protein
VDQVQQVKSTDPIQSEPLAADLTNARDQDAQARGQSPQGELLTSLAASLQAVVPAAGMSAAQASTPRNTALAAYAVNSSDVQAVQDTAQEYLRVEGAGTAGEARENSLANLYDRNGGRSTRR